MGTMIQFVAIGVRIAAIFIFLWGLMTFGSALYWTLKQSNSGNPFTWIIALFPFILAAILWLYPLSIAKGIVPKSETGPALKDISKNEIMVGGLTLMGIGILAVRIPDLFYWLIYLVNVHHYSEFPVKMFFPESSLEGLITSAVEIGFGIWLVLGGAGILKVINRIRFARFSS